MQLPVQLRAGFIFSSGFDSSLDIGQSRPVHESPADCKIYGPRATYQFSFHQSMSWTEKVRDLGELWITVEDGGQPASRTGEAAGKDRKARKWPGRWPGRYLRRQLYSSNSDF